MSGRIEEGIKVAIWLGYYWFDELLTRTLSESRSEEILLRLTENFITEFQDEIDGDWVKAFQNYNVRDYSELVMSWSRKKLWENFEINVDEN